MRTRPPMQAEHLAKTARDGHATKLCATTSPMATASTMQSSRAALIGGTVLQASSTSDLFFEFEFQGRRCFLLCATTVVLSFFFVLCAAAAVFSSSSSVAAAMSRRLSLTNSSLASSSERDDGSESTTTREHKLGVLDVGAPSAPPLHCRFSSLHWRRALTVARRSLALLCVMHNAHTHAHAPILVHALAALCLLLSVCLLHNRRVRGES